MKKLDRKAAVGIECRAQKLEKLMNLSSINDVRFVGICGMGGIGKTTLAASVYRKISHQFDASCFLADISKYSKMPSAGLSYLQGELLRRTLYERHINMSDMSECSYSSLQHRRMLVVLDDVDELKQLERLAKTREWFGVGSRIIITTRDEHILKEHGVDDIYKVGLLNEDEALQLFCMTAFKCDYPMSGYEEMTYSALEYVSGLPLAIKSLGSSLINLSVSEWRSVLPKLQETPTKSIQRVLRKSLDGLGSMEMQMFLDIACFFSGEDINYVKEIFISLHGEVYESIIGVLIDQSLVTISHQRIQMHYMLQKVGQEIVRDESLQKIGKQSRIWLYNDFCRALETRFLSFTRKIRLDNVEAIVLNQKDVEGTPLSARRFTYMNNLRLLILHNVNFSREGWLGLLSYKLQYISWHKYPFPYWPIDYYSPMLVECLMPDSHMTRLWTRKEMFPGLRRLDLRNSKYLLKTADFEGLPNLERIDLEGCTSLLLLHSSIACLPKLTFLNLKNCTSLVSMPNNLFDRSSLQVLNLAGCSQLVECLSFSPLKSSIQVKLLSIQLPSFLSKLLF